MSVLIAYFSLTYAVTWMFWGIASLLSGGVGTPEGAHHPVLRIVCLYLGTFTPAFVSLAMTAREYGRAGVRTLLARLFNADVRARWFVFAFGFMMVTKLVAALVHRVAFGEWPAFGTDPIILMFAATIFSVISGGQTGEELGWRGYALPRMATRMGLAPASVLLGVLWGTWHLPLFFFPASDLVGQSFPVFLLQNIALSVAIAFLWWRAGGSLLLTMILHAAVNNTKDIVPSTVPGGTDPLTFAGSRVAWITVVLLWVAAAYFIAKMPRKGTSVINLQSPI